VWILILFTFVIQAVSYEYRKKPDNLLGARTYEAFLFVNGSVGILLIGAAVGTFFTGSNFTLNDFNQVTWTHPLRGVEAAFSIFNLSLGLFLVFNARVLGSMYLVNNLDFQGTDGFEQRLRRACLMNLVYALPFLLIVLVSLLTMDGFGIDQAGTVSMVPHKYLGNLLAMPVVLLLLLAGLLLVIWGVALTSLRKSTAGIWFGGLGTVLVGLAVFFTAGFNDTPFYPSKADLQSSLSIHNASSSHFTLTAMSYVALVIPLVLAYIAYVWWRMDSRKLSSQELVADSKSY
jgi:cytochrome d ubiquinol oxidase subunit II